VPSVALQLLQACSQRDKAEIVALFCNIHCSRSKIEVKEINIKVLHHHFLSSVRKKQKAMCAPRRTANSQIYVTFHLDSPINISCNSTQMFYFSLFIHILSEWSYVNTKASCFVKNSSTIIIIIIIIIIIM